MAEVAPGTGGRPNGRSDPWETILVVDDEKNIRRTLQLVLEGEGYKVVSAETAEAGLSLLAEPQSPIALAIFDVKLPRMSGLDALDRIRKDDGLRHLPVVVMSGHATVSDAVQAIRNGAEDFVEKPLLRERILVCVRNVLDANRAKIALEEATTEQLARYEMIGRSAVMQRVFYEIERVAPTKASVLVTGESGTGKELISRAIHRLSPRANAPFIRVNCAAIPRELIESELFGHERGAFTGAQVKKRGYFEQAHGGTLFLDEIGDMDLVAQAKVLRALQSGEISRVGSEHIMNVDVRILAATNKDLAREVEAGRFREDLFFRLAVFPLRSPALRERTEDIPPLADAFFARFVAENGMAMKPIDGAVYEALAKRSWPGNVRELKNVVERMAILSQDRVTIADLPEDPHASPFDEDADTGGDGDPVPAWEPSTTQTVPTDLSQFVPLREHRERAERAYLLETLRAANWNISRASVVLGVERTNLHKKIRSHGIKRGE